MEMMIESIQAWVDDTEQVVSSQNSFDTLQQAEVEDISSRFLAVLGSNLTSDQVSLMARAVSLLLNVTNNLYTSRGLLIDLLQALLASFLGSDEIDRLPKYEY